MMANQTPLSSLVLEQIERLNGTLNADFANYASDYLPSELTIPLPFKQLFSVVWAENVYYSANEDGNFYWAQKVFFHTPQYCDMLDFGFQDRGNKELIRCCHAKGSYFIMLDLNDANPSNPMVYKASSGYYSPNLGNGNLLSDFLKSLSPA